MPEPLLELKPNVSQSGEGDEPMADEHGQDFTAGALRFNVQYRKAGNDRGPAVMVYGDVDGRQVQLLRFDCFDNGPHYHYDPDGKNHVLKLSRETVPDLVAWTLGELRENLKTMVRTAGYDAVAAQIDREAVAAVLPKVADAIRTAEAG
jgi:hypothetical protein